MPTVDDACSGQHALRAFVAGDVELEARRPVERAPPVGPDLGADPALAQECKRAAGGSTAAEIEMQRPAARAPKVQAPGGVEQGRELRSPVALALRRDRRELLANVLGRDQMETPSSARRRRLTSTPAPP